MSVDPPPLFVGRSSQSKADRRSFKVLRLLARPEPPSGEEQLAAEDEKDREPDQAGAAPAEKEP